MPQYQGVWTLQQQAQAQSNQQWVTDPNFKNTTLLLQADGTGSGSQNQTFLDGSTNNFFITRNGNTTQGSFSPFSQAPGYWGNYFDGSDDDLSTISSANLTPGSGDFTLECWIFPTSWASAGSYRAICANPVSGGMFFGQLASGFGFRVLAVNDVVYITTQPPANTWTHVAVSRSGTTTRLFINGALVSSATDTTTYVQDKLVIGNSNVAGTEDYAGYISNLRFVKGTAVYTASFVPPTAPLTAITNTQLLTCQSSRFVDNSTNAFALTVTGTPSVQAFGPFAPALQWTPTVVGGSGYFDGTGDYLLTPSTTTLALGTSDFTYETWFYPTATGGSKPIAYNYTGSGGFVVYWTAGNAVQLLLAAPSAWAVNFTSAAMPLNAWMHIAVVRSGTTVYFFINGVLLSTTTGVSGSMGTVALQSGTGGDPTGGEIISASYISGTRLVKGTAVYTAAFTPPTTPPTAITNTILLLNYTNAGIYDGKMANNLETVGNAQVATSPVKYGSGSMSFNGSSDYLYLPSNPALAMGTGNFTIECWAYFNQIKLCALIDIATSGTAARLAFVLYATGYLALDTNASPVTTPAGTIVAGQWYHLALVRTGTGTNQTTIYVNGVARGTGTVTNDFTFTTARVGNAFDNQYMNGYIDDMRVTKGVARYYTNFTPPQQALPRQ